MHGQVPYENYRKVFRAQQRHIERELNPVATASITLARTQESSSDGSSVETAGVSATLDGMIARVEALRSKACFLVPLRNFELITTYYLAI
jgi:macrophage erythroblast attacher